MPIFKTRFANVAFPRQASNDINACFSKFILWFVLVVFPVLFLNMKNLYLQIPVEQSANPSLVLATITGSTGSTPQKAGTSAIFGIAGLLAGTVGGGILEREVQSIAQAAIQSKQSGYYHFSMQHDISNEQDAICGGRVSVLIDASPTDHNAVFEKVKQSLLQRITGVLVTCVSRLDEKQVQIHRSWFTGEETNAISMDYSQLLQTEIASMLAQGKSGDFLEFPDPGDALKEWFFLEVLFPPPQLIIAGAGHIGKALAHLGWLLDFSVTVVDDRAGYANPASIPEADHFLVEGFGPAMQSTRISIDTFIVIVTRGHKHDADALKPCIGSGAAYIGMIGSSNKIALMRKKFIDEGWATADQWSAVHAPIGISIGSKTVQEIAISIAAELVQVRNSKA